jgi:hypothetical protein
MAYCLNCCDDIQDDRDLVDPGESYVPQENVVFVSMDNMKVGQEPK